MSVRISTNKNRGTSLAEYKVYKLVKIMGDHKMSVVKSENLVPNSYQENKSDNNSHREILENLINNISKLETLEKRLSFTLREIDLSFNKR